MTDEEFLAAMKIQACWLRDEPDPLAAALRIDDLRSAYCETLEKLVAEQALEIQKLRRRARRKRSA